MPLVAVVLAGAGAGAALYAGYALLARELVRQAEDVERELERRRAARSNSSPRNLGRLEWDEDAGVYRPIERG